MTAKEWTLAGAEVGPDSRDPARFRDRYLWHITLTTGDSRRSWRREVDDSALHLVSDLLERALEGEDAPIPAVQQCTLKVTAQGQCMIATVYRENAPLVTFGVAPHSRCGAALWRVLHERPSVPLKTSPDNCPGEPWCGARLESGIVLYPDTAHWLGDFERCVAWAWLLRRAQE